eukprot:463388-Pleurochrysis_carterae.AAC.1
MLCLLLSPLPAHLRSAAVLHVCEMLPELLQLLDHPPGRSGPHACMTIAPNSEAWHRSFRRPTIGWLLVIAAPSKIRLLFLFTPCDLV